VKDAELELLDAMFPDDIELAQTKKFTNTWKALRLASRDRFHLFNKFDDKFDEKRNDLEMLFEVEEKAKEEVRARVNQQAPATATPTKPQEKSLEANDNNSLAATDIDSTPPASVPAQIPTPIPTAPITNT
jgi:THO complex subunit 1